MAAETETKKLPESASPEKDDAVIRTEDVIHKGRRHHLTLLETGIRLVCIEDKSGANVNIPVFEVPWIDVISACETPVKKSKSISDSRAAYASRKAFLLHRIVQDAETKKCRCQSDLIETIEDNADEWIMQIEDRRKEGKPQRLLVVVNPIGGKGNARQVLRKRSQPLFALAGVELIIKATDRARHALEIGRTFDISSVDGVVVMGGDGLYSEILHSLILRAQEEEGTDFNNPDAKLVPPNIRIGILPGGTGNRVCGWLNGDVIDVETATLNIIRGETNPIGVFSVHEPGNLLHYGGLAFGYGFFSDVIKRSEELRWMKRARVPYVLLTELFGKKKVFNIDIDLLRDSAEKTASEDKHSEDDGWTKLGVKSVTAMLAILAQTTVDEEGNKLDINPFSDYFDLTLMGPARGYHIIRQIVDVGRRRREALEHDFTEFCSKLKGFRFRLVQDESAGGAASQQTSGAQDELGKLLDVDGELCPCTVPNVDIRLHPRLIQVFSVNYRR